MSFDQHADTVAKVRPVVERLYEGDNSDEKAHQREGRWTRDLAEFLGPSPAAAALSYLKCAHPDQTKGSADAGMLVAEWRQQQKASHREPLAEIESRLKTDGDLFLQMPICSWRIRFDFTLTADLYTRDESGFFAIENPMRRDRAFQMPTLAGS